MFYDGIKTTKMLDNVYEMEGFNAVKMWSVEGVDKCMLILSSRLTFWFITRTGCNHLYFSQKNGV